MQAGAFCRGYTESRRTCSIATGVPSAANCTPTAGAESTGGSAYEDEADARVDGSALDARLAGALAAMRPHERDALLLYALADLSYEEIALALDVPLGTVRTWLHRARATAQRELAAPDVDGSPLAMTGVDLNG